MSRLRLVLFARFLAFAALAGCAPGYAGVVIAPQQEAYTLGSGDRVRITVYGQPNLTATYQVDGAGVIDMPLLGPVEAGGRSAFELKNSIEARLRAEFLREPNVSVEVDSYRPFFILGEVTTAGQYAYVAGMTAEQAIAIAGGYSPRAYRRFVELTRRDPEGVTRIRVPLTTLIRPGDTITVKERWF